MKLRLKLYIYQKFYIKLIRDLHIYLNITTVIINNESNYAN